MTTVDKHQPGTITWFDLMASDPDKARAFYARLFGWAFETGGPETNFYSICTLGGRRAAGLGPQPPGTPYPPAWTVYFSVTDAEATAALIKEHRGQIMMGPMDVMEEGRLVFCIDPTGAPFGLWQPKRHQGAQAVDEPGAMCWAEVFTRDTVTARSFYAKVFDLEARKMEAPGFEYWTLHKGDKTVGGIADLGPAPANVPPHWMPYFAVKNTDATVKLLDELGGKVRQPAFDTPYGRMAAVSDPEGAMFSVIQLAPPA